MTHAVVWIDHKEARIFHVHPEAADDSRILPRRKGDIRLNQSRPEERSIQQVRGCARGGRDIAKRYGVYRD